MKPQIIVKNLSKDFTTYKKQPGLTGSLKSIFWRDTKIIQAVKDVSFRINTGEMVGFIGPNGAGKTTTLKMLSGLLHPTRGSCSVLGFNPFDRRSQFLSQISLIMGQKSQLWPDLPALETFELNREIYQVPLVEYRQILDELVELLEVKEVIYQQARKMSLGQRMKCELIASLIYRPKVLFLDEPTLGLDVLVQKKLRHFIKHYNSKYQSTILLTSHYMEDVKEVCRRVIIINRGGLIFDGLITDLIKKYADYKTISILFNQPTSPDKLNQFGKIIEFDPLKVTINVPRNSVSSTASQILTTFNVDDIDIAEPRLEDIIADVFEKN